MEFISIIQLDFKRRLVSISGGSYSILQHDIFPQSA
jgi:hypothetical protein